MSPESPSSFGKNALFSVILVSLCLVVGLAMVEGVLRLKNLSMQNYDIEMWRYARELKSRSANPKLGHEHIPSSEALLQSVVIRTNAEGLRGPALRSPAPERRILFLGASITLGWGVQEDKVLTSLVQEKFRSQGKDVEVLNAGIGNYNAERYTELYLTKLAAVQPTDIVIHYFLRDAEQLDAGGGNVFLRNSQLAVTLWIALTRLFGENGEGVLEKHYAAVYDKNAPGYKAMLTSLQKLVDHAKANNIRLTMAMVPTVQDLTNYRFGWIHTQMRAEAQALGIPFLDLLPAFGTLSAQEVWAMPGDPHPNAKGHALMADALFPILDTKN